MPYAAQLSNPAPNGSTHTAPTLSKMFHHRPIGGYKYKIEVTPIVQQVVLGGLVNVEIRCIVKTYKRGAFGGWNLNAQSVKITDQVSIDNIDSDGTGNIQTRSNIDITISAGSTKTFYLYSNFGLSSTNPVPIQVNSSQYWKRCTLKLKIKLFTSDGNFEFDY